MSRLSPAAKSAAGADVDALVIGAGPVGLYAAYYAGFRGPVVTALSGRQIGARFIVVTGGVGTFAPRRLPVLSEFEDSGVAYFVPRPGDYQGKDVAILGGGDSAFDWAIRLAPLARSVTLVHRREKFGAHPELVRHALGMPVPVLANSEVVAVRGNGSIEAIDVLDKQTQDVRSLRVQAVVAALGFTADIRPLQAWGLRTADRRIVVDTTMATNLDHVYAAGDITTYDGKVRLISVGFGEAATAVNNAAAAIDPAAGLFPRHSSDLPGSPASLPAAA